MSTLNGIGTRYLGQSDPRSDGSYVCTKWLCIVLPLIPLGSYRVWPESIRTYIPGMLSSSTFRAARAPLHLPHLFKWYGLYFAFLMFLVIADKVSTGR